MDLCLLARSRRFCWGAAGLVYQGFSVDTGQDAFTTLWFKLITPRPHPRLSLLIQLIQQQQGLVVPRPDKEPAVTGGRD